MKLLENLHYDPATGFFIWIKSTRNRKAGSQAGWLDNRYIRIQINGRPYLAHRLAWFAVHGSFPKEIDHINGNPTDNRIANLRPATRAQNQQNGFRPLKGATYHKTQKQWRARITVDGQQVFLGWFDTAEAAHAAYCAAAAEHFGEFFNPGATI